MYYHKLLTVEVYCTVRVLRFFIPDLVAERDGRIGEAAVPCHADLHADRLGEEVPDAVGDLRHHDGEADGEEKHPEEAAAALPGLVRGSAKTADVHLVGNENKNRPILQKFPILPN